MLRSGSNRFSILVQGLKAQGKTCTVVESSSGGLINSSIMAVAGSSSVYFGGSIAYNTRRSKKLLLNNDTLHDQLLKPIDRRQGESETDFYIRSKQNWTAHVSKAFCEQMNVDYAIAEAGASGPTFRPKDMDKGFSVIAIAGRDEVTKEAKLLAQTTIHSSHANRQANMQLFANEAANLAIKSIGLEEYDNSLELELQHAEANVLDRASHVRANEQKLKELESLPNAKFVVLRNSKECLFSSNTELAFASKVPSSIQKSFLGIDAFGSPIFAIDVDSNTEASVELPNDSFFDNTRTHAPLLRAYDNELALYATALSNWRRTHKFCSVCGQPLALTLGGTCLKCTSCNHMSWPRQDPSIIVLVTNPAGDKVLLGRSERHPQKMHTTLAGFVEAGETFERAVVREVAEETGAKVDIQSISYISSQPWPFPRSCMIGFFATADDTLPLCIDKNELVSAGWFDKAQVSAAARVTGPVMDKEVAAKALEVDPSLEILIPPKGVIARTLIDKWLIGM